MGRGEKACELKRLVCERVEDANVLEEPTHRELHERGHRRVQAEAQMAQRLLTAAIELGAIEALERAACLCAVEARGQYGGIDFMERYGGEELLALILDLLVVKGRLEHKHRSLYLWGEWRGVMVSTCMRQVEGRLEHEHRSLYLMREVIREVIRGHQRGHQSIVRCT